MGCRADLRRDAAAESLGGDSLGLLPQARNRRARQRSVACERELASGGTGRSLKNDSAYRLRIVRMANPVQHDLGHGLASRYRLGCGFIIDRRSEEHTSELQSLMRISYAVFCLKKKKPTRLNDTSHNPVY